MIVINESVDEGAVDLEHSEANSYRLNEAEGSFCCQLEHIGPLFEELEQPFRRAVWHQ